MKLLWISPYPLGLLKNELTFARPIEEGAHACTWIINLLPEIRQQFDGEIHLLTATPLVKKDQIVEKDGITFHVIKSGIPFLHRGCPAWFPMDALYGFYWLRLKIAREIRKINPDVIHAHGTEGVYGLAGVSQKTAPCLVSMQGVINELVKVSPTIRFRIMAFWERLTVKRGRYFACRTDYDTGFVGGLNPAARIYEQHEAINRLFFCEKRSVDIGNQILFVGTLVPWKGVDILLKAMARVVEQVGDVKLKIVGGGPPDDVAGLKDLVAELGLDRYVDFAGTKSSDAIVELQRQSRLFVLPSRNDNSPNSLVEAMAAGMPVVATDVGGVASMFEPGESGVLVLAENPDALAEEIIRLLEDPAECERLGANAAKLAQTRNDPTLVALQAINAYRSLAKI